MIQRLLIILLTAGAYFLPLPVEGQNEPAYVPEQIIAPSVVRQGDLALRLAQALALPNAEDEEEAIDALVTVGIVPTGGWMADYPMTPQLVTTLRDTVMAAAGRLGIGSDTAMNIFTQLIADYGLPLPADMSASYAGGGFPPTTYGPYCDGTALEYYYGNFGAPVYSYCPPPPAYLYLYSWVPGDFLLQRQAFTGFFVLKHFDRIPHHTRHERRRDHFAGADQRDDHHRRVFQADITPPPGQRHVFPADSQRHPATVDAGNKVVFHRRSHTPDASRLGRIVETGAASSPATPRAAITHRPHSDHAWSGVRADGSTRMNGNVPTRVVPMVPHKQTAQPPTERMRPQAPARVASVPAAVPDGVMPAPPTVVAPQQRNANRGTPGSSWSDFRGMTDMRSVRRQ